MEHRTENSRPEGYGFRLLRGVMVSQIWPDACDANGQTARAIRQVIDTGEFEAIQSVHVDSPEERREVRDLVETYQLTYTYCLARKMGREGLNLSSLDPELRRRSVEVAREGALHAVECGAARLSFVSGPGPEAAHRRTAALKALQKSLTEVGEQRLDLTFVLEPLDWNSHKRATLGTVKEGVNLCHALEREGIRLTLCSDTSHMLLNGEEPVEESVGASPFLTEFHFCNPVLRTGDPLFGDRHIPFGPPGALSVGELAPMLRSIVTHGRFGPPGPVSVSLEVLNSARDDAEASAGLLEYNRDIIGAVFAALETGPESPEPAPREDRL